MSAIALLVVEHRRFRQSTAQAVQYLQISHLGSGHQRAMMLSATRGNPAMEGRSWFGGALTQAATVPASLRSTDKQRRSR